MVIPFTMMVGRVVLATDTVAVAGVERVLFRQGLEIWRKATAPQIHGVVDRKGGMFVVLEVCGGKQGAKVSLSV